MEGRKKGGKKGNERRERNREIFFIYLFYFKYLDVKLFATPEKPSVFPNPSPSLFFKTFMKPSSPTRRFYRPDQIPLKPEMLGAGTDPLAKNQDFSILAGKKREKFKYK